MMWTKDASLAIPILTAYIAAHPNLKAIGTQHGNITAELPKVLQAAGRNPVTSSVVVLIFTRYQRRHHPGLDSGELRSGALPARLLPS